MLQGNYYHIKSIKTENETIKAEIAFNQTHEIFKGHFPETPVVPGVCMIQITKEIFEQVHSVQTNLTHADQIKFLTVINPVLTPIVCFELKYSMNETGDFLIFSSLFNEGTVYFKMKAVLRK